MCPKLTFRLRATASSGSVLVLAAAMAPSKAPRARFTCGALDGKAYHCTYIAPGVRLRIADSVFGALSVVSDVDGQARVLPRFYGNTIWRSCNLVYDRHRRPLVDHVVATDLDGDGRTDLVLVGACTTGAGPTGGQPFAVGTIYLQRAPGEFRIDDRRDSVFTDALPDACAQRRCDVLEPARYTLNRR